MGVIEKKIMKLFVTNPSLIKLVTITENQASIVKEVATFDFPTMSAKELAESREISVQNASGQLVALWKKGYFSREERVCSTGGIIYRYKSLIKFTEEEL